MYETGKSVIRRLHSPDYATRYFVGHGIDIGAGPDSLGAYAELFPRIQSVRAWDLEDGDAQVMAGVNDETFDFVHSSHCLEHMRDPVEALANWWRILKPGGYLVVIVPDEDLYEQGVWPSTFNGDHKATFTLWKAKGQSWSPPSVNVVDLVTGLGADAEPVRMALLNAGFRYKLGRTDQTATMTGESAIEFVVRKR